MLNLKLQVTIFIFVFNEAEDIPAPYPAGHNRGHCAHYLKGPSSSSGFYGDSWVICFLLMKRKNRSNNLILNT